jgi:Domain of unknown function (DUF1906)/N-acetylmuramoyl-L-alanine amidase
MAGTYVCDYSYARPSPVALRAAGYTGVVRYLSHTSAKAISAAELVALHAAGLSVALVWQDSATVALKGATQGAADGEAANVMADALGWGPSRPIYFAVDFDVVASQLPAVLAYLRGAATGRPVGVYGSAWLLDRVGSAARYFWQPQAWSLGKVSPMAMLLQHTGDQRIPETDHNDVLKGTTDWGQVPPMMLTDLATVLRARGLTVVEEAGWKARGHGPMSGVASIICHHTAGATGSDTGSLSTVIYGRSDLPGPLANLYLARSGIWHVVAAGLAYHAGAVDSTRHSNAFAIGIEAENDGVPPLDWPLAETDSYALGCAALADHYGVPLAEVLGHKEVAPSRKIDPDFSMPAFRLKVGTFLRGATDMPIDDADVKKILTAPIDAKYTEASGDTVTVQDALGLSQRWALFGAQGAGRVEKAVAILTAQLTKQGGEIVSVGNAVTALTMKVDALAARPTADVDEVALADALVKAGLGHLSDDDISKVKTAIATLTVTVGE